MCKRECNNICDLDLESFFPKLDEPGKKAKKFIESIMNIFRDGGNHRQRIPSSDEDERLPEAGYYLYETIRYPPKSGQPHETVN